MAQASVVRRRALARNAALAAKARRTKVIVIVLVVVLAALLAYQLPKLLGHGSSSSAAPSSPGSPAATGRLAPGKLPAILRRGGSGADPFAIQRLADFDPRIAPGGGRDPFAARLSTAAAVSTRAASTTLPKRIVIGTPGAHKHLVRGWIVILASIPVGNGHAEAVAFARRVKGLGPVSTLNSSNRRPLRGGYWVVYAGPVRTLSGVSRLATRVHSAGYRSAYIRELFRYR
jgi:hypothetical protein